MIVIFLVDYAVVQLIAKFHEYDFCSLRKLLFHTDFWGFPSIFHYSCLYTTKNVVSLSSKQHSVAQTKSKSKICAKLQCTVTAKKGVPPEREEIQLELP